MRVFVSQVYIDPGAAFPFSAAFQRYISHELTATTTPSESFACRFGEDWDLIFNMSAKTHLVEPEIVGPTIFRRDKDVEFTIFLPLNTSTVCTQPSLSTALCNLLESIVRVLQDLGIDTIQIESRCDDLVTRIVGDPKMIKQ
jgi:hypothetical protein